MNTVESFYHDALGEIRVHKENGKPWFCLIDVVRCLGLQEITKVTRYLTKLYQQGMLSANPLCFVPCVIKTGIRKDGTTFEQIGPLCFVSEAGLNLCVMRSQKAEAVQFTIWMAEVVLPAIRQSGAYVDGEEYLSKEDAQKLKQEKATLTMKLGQMKSINNRLRKQLAQKESDFWDAQEAMLNDREHLIRRMEAETDIGNLILEGLYAY